MENLISVIIVNYKSWKPLGLCLEALLAIDLTDYQLEIVVVDNQSNDGELHDFQQQYPLVHFYLNAGNCGFAHGCNYGAQKARGNHFLFLNPDTIPTERNILSLIKTYIQYPALGILGMVQHNERGKQQHFQKPLPSPIAVFGPIRALYSLLLFSKKRMLSEHLQLVPWITGSCVLISKKWFEKVQGWDTDFWMYSEDIALSKAIQNNGGQVAILLEPSLLHSHGGASRINPQTTALTKLEVMISRHVYISKYQSVSTKYISHFLTIINHILIASLGVLLTFNKNKNKSKRILLGSLRKYYSNVPQNGWKSTRVCKSVYISPQPLIDKATE